MQYSQGGIGRAFSIRLEHGEPMPETLERFLAEKEVTCGVAIMVGGAEHGSKFVVGPEDGEQMPPRPMVNTLQGVHEAAAVGTVFPDESGKPVLHMHAAFGREDQTRSGCIRAGISTWQILEIVVLELTGVEMVRLPDAATGFHLLQSLDP